MAENDPAAPAVPATPAQALKLSVTEALAAGGPAVRERVKTHLVEDELKRRTNLVLQGLTKREEQQREINKIKPKPPGYTATGAAVGEPSFSKEQVDQLKKLTGKLQKIDGALNAALGDNPNYDPLSKIASGKEDAPEGEDKKDGE
jgi:hypothetical protein